MDNRLKKFYSESKQNNNLSPEAQQRVKERVFANLGAAPEAAPVSVLQKFNAVFMRGYVLAPLVVLLFVAGTGIASADAVPGDTLYVVKRKLESARIFVAPTEEAKLELKMDFAEKRLDELEQMHSGTMMEDETEENQESGKPEEARQDDDSGKGNSEVRDEHRMQAREEASHAMEALKEVQKKFEEKGRENKVEEIDKKLEQFQTRLNDKNSR